MLRKKTDMTTQRKTAGRSGSAGNRPRGKHPRGVIILEILVVMIILALILTLVAPSFLGQAEKAKVTVTKDQIRSLGLALKLYRLHNSTYPTREQGLEALLRKPDVGVIPRKWEGPYLDANSIPRDGWDNPFIYLSNGQEFEIISLGADGQEGGSELNADISSRNQ